MADRQIKAPERRRARRTRLKLRGRFLLPDGSEHPCETIDVSVTGVSMRGYVLAHMRERVVAYLDELGRLEGFVSRRGDDWFAITVKIPQSRIDRLSQKLASLSGESEAVDASAAPSQPRKIELRTEFGQRFPIQLCDETQFGARVIADFNLIAGAQVTIEHRSAVVTLETSDGFLVRFQ